LPSLFDKIRDAPNDAEQLTLATRNLLQELESEAVADNESIDQGAEFHELTWQGGCDFTVMCAESMRGANDENDDADDNVDEGYNDSERLGLAATFRYLAEQLKGCVSRAQLSELGNEYTEYTDRAFDSWLRIRALINVYMKLNKTCFFELTNGGYGAYGVEELSPDAPTEEELCFTSLQACLNGDDDDDDDDGSGDT
jgi:hypothetical protein